MTRNLRTGLGLAFLLATGGAALIAVDSLSLYAKTYDITHSTVVLTYARHTVTPRHQNYLFCYADGYAHGAAMRDVRKNLYSQFAAWSHQMISGPKVVQDRLSQEDNMLKDALPDIARSCASLHLSKWT